MWPDLGGRLALRGCGPSAASTGAAIFPEMNFTVRGRVHLVGILRGRLAET